jgi:hypothetical protein
MKIFGLLGMLLLATASLFGQQLMPPGVDSVVITFDYPPSVTVQKAPLKYNKAFAMSFQMDDALSDIFNKVYPVFHGDGTTPGLTFTDGCGHPVTFKMSSGVFIFSSNNNTDILNPGQYHDQSKLTWPQLSILYRSHWGIENHGLFDNPDVSSPEKIEYAFQRTKSYVRRKVSDSVTFKSFVIPNNIGIYATYLSKNKYHAAINQGMDNSWIGYGDIGVDLDSDTINWLKPVKLNRLFLYSDFKKSADTLYAQSQRGVHKWFLSGMHTLPGSFLSELREIYQTYGSPGRDDILLAPDDEILDYLAVKQAVQIHKNLKDNKLTITFSGNVPTDRIYYALSLNVFGDQPIRNIQVYGTDKYSFEGVGKDTALINLSWDGRFYYSTEMLADSFTRQAMLTGSPWKALVAMDYVTKLPQGAEKIRLQDSLCSLDLSGWSPGYDAGFCNLVHLGPDTTLCPGDSLSLSGPENMATYQWFQNGEPFSHAPAVVIFPDTTTTYSLTVTDLSGNIMSDTLQVTVFPVPRLQLGNDTGLCAGSCLTLNGPQGEYAYRWSTGDTTASVTVCPVSDTTITLRVLTTDGCRTSDSITLFHHLLPQIDIPQDSASYCYGDSVFLTASATGPEPSFQWNTGDTSSSFAFLPATADTVYHFSVTAVSSYGCRSRDSAEIIVLPKVPAFHLGADTGLCAGSCLTLSGPQGEYAYRWSTGDTTASVTVCPVSDTSVLLQVFTHEKCTASDSLFIRHYLPPESNIQQDGFSYCFGDSVYLSAATFSDSNSFLWSTGDTTPYITVLPSFADTTLVYTAAVISSRGCQTIDTANITILPAVKVRMNTDTLQTCAGVPVTLSCTPIQGNITSYVWVFNSDTLFNQNNTTTISNPDTSGPVYVIATGVSGCQATDSAYLRTISYPNTVISGDTAICAGDSVSLTATGGGRFFLWVKGRDTLSRDSVLHVKPSETTVYRLWSGFDTQCLRPDSLKVLFFPLPKTKIIHDTTPICMHSTLHLKAEGADSYRWMPGEVPGDTFSIKLTDTLTVFLTGKSKEGCLAKDSLTLSPAPLPVAHFSGLMLSYCENDPAVTLQGDPAGGIFSGEGIKDTLFIPALAGPGNHSVFYTIISREGCAGKVEKETYVYGPVPAIRLKPADTTLLPGGFVQYDAGPGFDAYYWTTGDLSRIIRVYYNNHPVGTDTIRVVGITGGCSSVGSAAVTFAKPAGIITAKNNVFTVFPNPAHTIARISFHGDGNPVTVVVFDFSGKRILRQYHPGSTGNCTLNIDVTPLKAGVYFVGFYREGRVYFSKMVVQ